MNEAAPPREPDQIDGVPAPEECRQVLGHGSVLEALDGLVAAAQMPSAILLHGPRGIGKASVAFAVAQRLLTASGDESAERVAAQIASGAHPNVRVLRIAPKEKGAGFESAIRVERVRALIDSLHQTRGRSGYRVCVVDSIDDCNVSSTNALLKILEEPPSETVFMLISHRPGSLLPTIRSRCRAYALRGIADTEVRAVLATLAPDAEGETLERAVALADGRPRRALEAMLLSQQQALEALHVWLSSPSTQPVGAHLAIAESLSGRNAVAEAGFAREMIDNWLADEARRFAAAGIAGRFALASVNQLWEKAHALFADADGLNIDARQTLIAVLDAIREHDERARVAATETQ